MPAAELNHTEKSEHNLPNLNIIRIYVPCCAFPGTADLSDIVTHATWAPSGSSIPQNLSKT
jgi:hypothetical protein